MDAVVGKLDLTSVYTPFEGSEYPMPVAQAILGEMPDVAKLCAFEDDATTSDGLEAFLASSGGVAIRSCVNARAPGQGSPPL